MVIKLKPRKKTFVQAPTQEQRFTIQDIEDLFNQSKNWKKFYEENESRLWESKIDIYDWPVYPLCIKEDKFYKCVLHDQVEVNCGSDKKPIMSFFKNIHYAEFISHCIYYKPEQHKQYIIEKLFGNHNVNSSNTSTGTTTTTPTAETINNPTNNGKDDHGWSK